MALPFDVYDTTSYNLIYYLNPYSSSSASSPITLVPKSTPTYQFPDNFYRLNLFTTAHVKFSQRDPNTSLTTSYSCGSALYCFKDNKAFTCNNNNYLDVSTFTCASTCPTNYQVGTGSTATRGYCNIYRNPTIYTITGIRTFDCVAGYTKVYDDCVNLTDTAPNYTNADYRGALYYSYFYQLPYIQIDINTISTSLNNIGQYYLEFWFLYETNKYLYPTQATNYMFYTNAFKIQHDAAASVFKIENCSGSGGTTFTNKVNLYNWNKFTVKVTAAGASYSGRLYLNNDFSASYSFTACTLSTIYFCHNDSSCPIGNINWTSGFYRDLRIWDGVTYKLNDSIVQQYSIYDNHYFLRSIANNWKPFVYRHKYITVHFPLNISNIKDNLLKDEITTTINYNVNTPFGSNTDRIYNLGTMFDNVRTKKNLAKYVDNNFDLLPCNVECSSCTYFGTNDCQTCTAGIFYYKDNKCVTFPNTNKAYYAYVSPTQNYIDLKFAALTSYATKLTISFFVKILGFADITDSDIIIFGSNLKLSYDHTADVLKLKGYGTKSTVYATSSGTFSANFGTYVHIALAYQWDTTKSAYHPPMMNFQINNSNLVITYTNNDLDNLDLANITIPKTFFGLFARLVVYNNFLIGANGYVTNKYYWTNSPMENPAKTLIDENNTNCIALGNLTGSLTLTEIQCFNDYDIRLDKTNYINQIYDGTTTPVTPSRGFRVNAAGAVSNYNCPIASPLCYETCYSTTECSCRSNSLNYMIFKNNDGHLCKSKIYLK